MNTIPSLHGMRESECDNERVIACTESLLLTSGSDPVPGSSKSLTVSGAWIRRTHGRLDGAWAGAWDGAWAGASSSASRGTRGFVVVPAEELNEFGGILVSCMGEQVADPVSPVVNEGSTTVESAGLEGTETFALVNRDGRSAFVWLGIYDYAVRVFRKTSIT